MTDDDRFGWNSPKPARVPDPSAWPMVLAFGACLLAWGIVTSWILSAVGFLVSAISLGGWISEMRHDQRN